MEEALESDENVLSLVSNPDFWWYRPWESSFELTETACTELVTRLDNPIAFPLLLADVWSAATVNYANALGRHLVVACPDGNVTDEAMDTWLRKNPFEVYAVAFAWEEHAEAFLRDHGRLEGPRGALFLAHAAYAALMTGLSLDGPAWTELLETRDADDPLIAISHHFYELGQFRDGEENACRLRELVASASGECRAILDAAGIVVGGNGE